MSIVGHACSESTKRLLIPHGNWHALRVSGLFGGFIRSLVVSTLAVLLGAVGAVMAPPAHASDSVTVTTLHFDVTHNSGPRCDVIGDLYVPHGVSSAKRAPAILTTNGFSGSKDDQAPLARMFAARGYVVLAYSGLGFGGSGCRVTFDSPTPDGDAASRLVSYLGGTNGIAFRDAAHTTPAPVLDVVQRDSVDHRGAHSSHDPRVGMIGGSYGGHIQFAAASVDPRIDTIVPMATWNDLSYSLSPNNTGQTVGVSTPTQGAVKLNWSATLVAGGLVSGVQHAAVDPQRLAGCPDFPAAVCDALVQSATTGTVDPSILDEFRRGSVASFLDRITIPTLLVQGEQDTLFTLREALATHRGLSARGVPTSMIWFSGGHSGSPAPGDFSSDKPDPDGQYVMHRATAWLDHYLKGTGTGTGPAFAYFRNWIDYRGIATPAYATATTVDVGNREEFALSGVNGLVPSSSTPRRGTARLTTPPAGLPTSHDKPDALGLISAPERDVAGTFAQWDTAPLPAAIDVVGAPTLQLRVRAPKTNSAALADQLVLFTRLVDVDAAGVSTTVGNLVAPVRISNPNHPVTITLPAVVHRFGPGHRLRLVVSGGSTNYRGGMRPTPVSIDAGPEQTLRLPVV